VAEYILTKPDGKTGRCDLVLPLRKHLIVTEWKSIQIDYLDIRKPRKSPKTPTGNKRSMREIKASILSTYTLQNVLDLKFGKNDYRAGKKLKQWIIETAAPQVKDYVTSEEVKKKLKDEELLLEAHLVVIVGSRHILVWDIDSDGELKGEPKLVGQLPT
jgi:hypothetical protein